MIVSGDMAVLRWKGLLAGVALATAVTVGCVFFVSDPGGSARPVRLIVSGDTAGWIVPCGCASNQSGGLLRRGTYVSGQREQSEVVLVDAGGAAGGTSDYDRLKFEAILRGEVRMGIAAHNLGRAEASLGAGELRALAERTGVPFVSANLRDAEGTLLAEPVRIIETGAARLAIVGVLSPKYERNGLTVDEPRDAILRAVEPFEGEYDHLVVLAYLPQEELEQLAAALPEAEAVIGGPTGQAIAPRREGPALLAAATNKGKFLVRLDIPSSAGADWSGEIVEMGPSLEDESAQTANLKAYLSELAARDFSPDQTSFAPRLPADLPEGYRIAGSDRCAECHQSDCDVWEASGHAHAWTTIEAKGFHVDSWCQHCHTTGYGLPGGFASAKQGTNINVGCESCHGPSEGHASDPSVRTPFAAADSCLKCHDPENSPQFEYTKYWPKIEHGGK